VTEQCGIGPLLADEAGLVVRHDATALAEALSRVLGDTEFRAHLAAGCAQVTARLGWDEPIRETEALYSTLAPS
jgi:glycosyltransferase involved in cell wall biosynthesis